ncbi:LytTR family DNA-binding domain-containing protein [Spirosoma foliorum]|uniref:LytTR family transcriptional regulator n=1 Tax=Spirosoma foliorum TaxID=2710596 RepID=A0A7G5H4M1_9BACT|nr:LytTR family DNA-binding domain-containing protein [Spirosoma foliorum]QMW06063.1 LytTR family transcriptional regulator [Spirosoma foliorum]
MKKRQPFKSGVNYFEPKTVLYLTGDVNYSHVHLLSGQIILSCRTLKWFAQQWPYFIRVHKQALVNPIYIHQLNLGPTLRSNSYLIMQDAAQLAISRRRVASVVAQVGQTNNC